MLSLDRLLSFEGSNAAGFEVSVDQVLGGTMYCGKSFDNPDLDISLAKDRDVHIERVQLSYLEIQTAQNLLRSLCESIYEARELLILYLFSF